MGICTGIRLGKFTVTPLSRGFEGKPVGYVVRAFRTGCALDILLEPFPFLRSVRTLGQAWLRVEPTWSDANPQLVRLERPSSLAGSGINDLVKFAAPAMIATHFRNFARAVPAAATAAPSRGETLAQTHGCLACHAVAQVRIGPAFNAVAQRYADKADALASLTAKVRGGGAGNWGSVAMPAQAAIGDADLAEVLRWVLASASAR